MFGGRPNAAGETPALREGDGKRGLIAEAGSDEAGAGHPGVIEGDAFAFAGDFFQGDRFGGFAAGGNHDAEDIVVDELGAGRAEAGGKECGRWRRERRRAGRSRGW